MDKMKNSGKMRRKVIYCSPGYLNIYSNNSFYVSVETVDEETKNEDIPKVAVHRFYNSNIEEHLFTTNTLEALALAALGWTYEGIAFNSQMGPIIYRNYDGTRHSYTYEYRPDTEGYAFRMSEGAHLLVNPINNDNVITESEKEYWDLLELGWEDLT